MTDSDADRATKLAVSLAPPTAFTLGSAVISSYETSQVGMQWQHLFSKGDMDYSLGDSILFFFVDSLAFIVLGNYFEEVLPSEHGTAR